jgi:helix-turn-helix protein
MRWLAKKRSGAARDRIMRGRQYIDVGNGRILTPCNGRVPAFVVTPLLCEGCEVRETGTQATAGAREYYSRLILAGVGTVLACHRLRIGRKTGHRWRAERGGIPPALVAEAARSSRFLSLLERQRVATLRDRGLGVREIARRLGRAPSTISRQLRRNTPPHDNGIYDADLAHARARASARRERIGKLIGDDVLRALVQQKLELDWSPQQIAAWLGVAHPDRSLHVCHAPSTRPSTAVGKAAEQEAHQTTAHHGAAAQAPQKGAPAHDPFH